jgi:hypothetical protein
MNCYTFRPPKQSDGVTMCSKYLSDFSFFVAINFHLKEIIMKIMLELGIVGVICVCGHDPFICITSVLVIMAKAILYSFIISLGVVKVDLVNFDMQA